MDIELRSGIDNEKKELARTQWGSGSHPVKSKEQQQQGQGRKCAENYKENVPPMFLDLRVVLFSFLNSLFSLLSSHFSLTLFPSSTPTCLCFLGFLFLYPLKTLTPPLLYSFLLSQAHPLILFLFLFKPTPLLSST